jgi:hypothetical protein
MAQLRSPNANSGLTAQQDTRVLAKNKNSGAKASKPAKKAGGNPSKPAKPASTPAGNTGTVRADNATSGGVVNTNLNGGVRTCLDERYGKIYWQGTNTGCLTNADCSGIVVKDGTACCLWPYCICGASVPGAAGVGCSTV